jgi:hypothetical protein
MSTLEIAAELRAHLAICQEFLALFTEENVALRGPQSWSAETFHEQRKRLLPQLESVLMRVRVCRETWSKMSDSERARCGEINQLLRDIQNLLPRILSLDRENQQEMLRRGVVPAAQLDATARTATAAARPHFVAGLYQRHAIA